MARLSNIRHRRDTAANWTSVNPILDAGEIGVETDTLKSKVGNGSTAWTSLAYIAAGNSDTTTLATTTSKVRTWDAGHTTTTDRAIFVSATAPTGMVTGDIWIQV
jgi:hypothetical protein